MSVAHRLEFAESTYVRDLEGLYVPWKAAPAPEPRLLARNDALAAELRLDPAWLAEPDGLGLLTGTVLPEGATPVAMAYSGHQFGGFSPRLGDGRALLLGELVDVHGRRVDLHLKGSGRTPFSRGGDGKAAVGPMLREHLVSEAMHVLGIPTSRSLGVVATGEEVARETMLPGAVLARVAASHLRVGTFEYAAAHGDPALVKRLADYAIARHHPAAAETANPHLALFEAVVEAQASLIARWMGVGFVHGVMNTDNMAISGETIDYGPCAFMEAYDPATVFSSIDHAGRYAYANQPAVAQWNLARLAEALLVLIDPDPQQAVAAAMPVLEAFPERYEEHRLALMRAKLGLLEERPGDRALIDGLLALLQEQGADWTATFRGLSTVLRGGPSELGGWEERWRGRLAAEGRDPSAAADAMDAINPVYVPRNNPTEEALAAATVGDLEPFDELMAVLARPFEERPGMKRYAVGAPAGDGPYRTFCGT